MGLGMGLCIGLGREAAWVIGLFCSRFKQLK